MPARLSPVKRGEVRVRRPDCLAGMGAAFAFHPPDDSLAPSFRTRDLLYALPGQAWEGELVLVVTKDGRGRLGHLASVGDDVVSFTHPEAAFPLAEVAEVAMVAMARRLYRQAR